MKNLSKEIETLLNSGSEEYKEYLFDMYIGSLENQLFENPYIPIRVCDDALKCFLKGFNKPFQTIE